MWLAKCIYVPKCGLTTKLSLLMRSAMTLTSPNVICEIFNLRLRNRPAHKSTNVNRYHIYISSYVDEKKNTNFSECYTSTHLNLQIYLIKNEYVYNCGS